MTDFFDLDKGGAEAPKESLGGFSIPESGVYPFKVVQAYADKYQSGSKFISVTFKIGDNQEHTERFLMSSGQGKSYWTDKDGKNHEYTSVTRMEELLYAAGLQGWSQAGMAPGKIRAWDSSSRAFTLQSHEQVLHALRDAEGLVAIEKVIENKQEKGDKGYRKTNNKVENAYVRKISKANGMTKIEEAKGINPPVFMEAWKERYAGNTTNQFKLQADAPQVGAPPAIGGDEGTSSMFD